MKCNPNDDAVTLVAETDMEASAMERWKERRPQADPWGDQPHGSIRVCFPVREEAAPRPPCRCVRVPAIGQRVKVGADGREGVVTQVAVVSLTGTVAVRVSVGDFEGFWEPSTALVPVGDDPKWITIEMPEE